MRCRECELLLWAYLDDELSEAERRGVTAHLAGCPQCTRTYEQLRSFPLQANQLHSVPPPPDFTARLMQRIAPLPSPYELAAQQERARTGAFRGPIGLMLAFSTAAAAIVIGLIGTSALVLFSGRTLAPTNTEAIPTANALSFWMADALWQHLTWPVVLTLVGMLVVLALLWFRIALPYRASMTSYGFTDAPRRRSR
jgi:anti-sigma factor RsiW